MVKSATLDKERGVCLILTEVPHALPFSDSVFHIYIYRVFFQGMVERRLFISQWASIVSGNSVTMLIAEAWVIWVQFSAMTAFPG